MYPRTQTKISTLLVCLRLFIISLNLEVYGGSRLVAGYEPVSQRLQDHITGDESGQLPTAVIILTTQCTPNGNRTRKLRIESPTILPIESTGAYSAHILLFTLGS